VTGKYGSDTATASATAKVTVQPAAPAPEIGILKTPNPGTLPVGGGEVAYSYAISNKGNVPLSNITLSDDKCASIVFGSGDTNLDLKLDLDEIWMYSCTVNLTGDHDEYGDRHREI